MTKACSVWRKQVWKAWEEGRKELLPTQGSHIHLDESIRQWARLFFGFLLNLKNIDAKTLPLTSQGL